MGICQFHSSIYSPVLQSQSARVSEFVKTPALCLPSAIEIAPVRVESSIIVLILQFCWTQFMQSARTNLPSASVFPIYTVSPFLDLMISKGRQLFELIKFQATPRTATIFNLVLVATELQKALNTEQAPCLSPCIPAIPAVDFKLSPPASKHNPFPTNPQNGSVYAAPFHSRLINKGSLSLALPTAWRRLNPQFNNQMPFMTFILTPGQDDAILSAYLRMKAVFASLPREFAHSAAFILALASSKTYSLSGISATLNSICFQSFYFLENLYPFVNIQEAIPQKFLLFFISLEKSIDVVLLISFSFLQLFSEQNLVVNSRVFAPSPVRLTQVTVFFYPKSLILQAGKKSDAFDE